MSAHHTKYSKLFLTTISFFLGYAIKRLLKKGWKKTYNEDPPGEVLSEEVNWGKLIIWTVLSGLLLRLIKVGIKRSIALSMKNEDFLID